ncbi:MAG: hypothetical protein M1816_000514 [Peltula sp. TS41687]|nr:MAG: hypothetical protein M1816_000514 [Peltula sp. TS41687]
MAIVSTEPSVKDNPFKVIIVGAGVGGLVLAHALHKADIDYVLLDKGIVAPPWGSSITIHAPGARILQQIGCLDRVESVCKPLEMFYNRTTEGKSYLHDNFGGALKILNGYAPLSLERRAFLQALYDELPDQSKVIERSRVIDIVESNEMVRIILADGTVHEGDLCVGTDGVHSMVREVMWKTANLSVPGLISASEKRRMVATYECLIGIAPMQPGLGKVDMTCVCNNGFSFLFLTQPDSIFFAVHCKTPRGHRWPSRVRYNEADAEALAAKLAEYPVSDSLVFGEIWRSRTRGVLVSLEEGVLDHWFFGRTVLAGDSVHKVTPNAALGGGTTMESVVVLANEIRRAIRAHPNQKPSDLEIRTALQRYQDQRLPRVTEIFNLSWMVTRLQAYDGWLYYLAMRWILPVLGLGVLAKNMGVMFSEAPKLDYVPVDERKGKIPWKEMNSGAIVKSEDEGRVGKRFSVVLGALVVLFSSSLWWLVGALRSMRRAYHCRSIRSVSDFNKGS